MAVALCIVGRSNTGKTTLIERLVPEFKGRGFRVAVVKHSEQVVDWDQPGKDTYRFAKAGSDAVLLSTKDRVLVNFLTGKTLPFEESLRYIGGDCDLVLVEGYHETQLPKIEVHRRELGQPLLTDKHGLMALVTDEKLDVTAPQFSRDDVQGIADLVVRKLLSSVGKPDAGLFVDGKPVNLTPFVAEIIAKTVQGMLSSLKGVGEPRDVDLWIRTRSS